MFYLKKNGKTKPIKEHVADTYRKDNNKKMYNTWHEPKSGDFVKNQNS